MKVISINQVASQKFKEKCIKDEYWTELSDGKINKNIKQFLDNESPDISIKTKSINGEIDEDEGNPFSFKRKEELS